MVSQSFIGPFPTYSRGFAHGLKKWEGDQVQDHVKTTRIFLKAFLEEDRVVENETSQVQRSLLFLEQDTKKTHPQMKF